MAFLLKTLFPSSGAGSVGTKSSNMDAAAKLREKFNKQPSSDDNSKMSNTEMSTLLINPEKAKENQEKYEQDLLHKHREEFRQEVIRARQLPPASPLLLYFALTFLYVFVHVCVCLSLLEILS